MYATRATCAHVRFLFLSLFLLSGFLLPSLLLLGCSGAPEQRDSDAGSTQTAALADTPANRLRMAQEIIKAFPTSGFVSDLQHRINSLAGSDVGEAVQTRLVERIGLAKLEAQRMHLLVDRFTVPELQELRRLYQSRTGLSLLRKMPAYDEGWRTFLAPIVMEELSGADSTH